MSLPETGPGLLAAGVPPEITLVCFAVRQEAKPFQRFARGQNHIHVVCTGMGSGNAERALRNFLASQTPARVFTCGFAGALNPMLRIGDVVFQTKDAQLGTQLSRVGAKPGLFSSVERVVTTAAEKSSLRRATNQDAVEMESGAIQSVCAEVGLPCATVRVISDQADEDLPLDFNALLTTEHRLNPVKLAVKILTSPRRVPALIRLGKNSAFAAEQLAHVLQQTIQSGMK